MLGEPQIAYNIETLRNLLRNVKTCDDIENIKKYVSDYFGYCSSSPGVLMWYPGKKMCKHYLKKDAVDMFFPRGSTTKNKRESISVLSVKNKQMVSFDITNWFCDVYRQAFYENYHPAKPRVYEEEDGTLHINRFAGFLHKNPRPFKEYSKEVISRVKMVLDHMNHVLCSGIPDQYYYLVNWTARVVSGIHVNKAIYLYSEEHGTGKTIFTNFLRKKVVGEHITHLTGSNSIILGDFNIEMIGKVLLLLEEMPVVRKGDWNAFGNRLKWIIDSDTIQLTEKHKTPFPVNNITSIMINSNSKVIKIEKSDRRYFIPDIAKKQSYEYYKQLSEAMEYPEVGEAFYSYMLELVKLNSDFDPINIPTTKTKTEMIGTDRHSLYEYVKLEYLSKRDNIFRNPSKVPASRFYNDYKDYYKENYRNKKVPSIQEVSQKMKEIGFVAPDQRIDEKRARCYNLSYNKVFAEFDRRGMTDPHENLEEPKDYTAPEINHTPTQLSVLKVPEESSEVKPPESPPVKKPQKPIPPPKPKNLQVKKDKCYRNG